MPEPEFQDFDPKFDMQQMSVWLLDAADYAEIVLKNHRKKADLCKELRHGAASIAFLHGQFVGAFNALKPVTALIPEAAQRRDGLRAHYTASRAYFIEAMCQHYLEATVMYRQVQHGPGRPRAPLPSVEAFERASSREERMKMLQYSYEFAIAVELERRKTQTGKYHGLNKLLSDHIERGLIDDVGDTAQRIKRLARQLHKESPLYLTPGLREARATAQQFIYSPE
ncbi:MAG: hypothetical protein ACKVP5_15450 [Aestuariivirga sp.]